MSWMPIEWVRRADPGNPQSGFSDPTAGLQTVGAILRAVFVVAILLVTLRVSMPQNETIWTAYETPGDLIRMGLGFAVCAWIVVQLFWLPTDTRAYRTWLYLGLAAVPFAVICVIAVW